MKTIVIVPAYNERENIRNVVQTLKTSAPYADYIVINDCSTDDTREILRGIGANFLDLPVNLGIGGGVQTGYCYALEHGYEIAVQFDGDGQHDAACIRDLITPIEHGEADLVIGSRFLTNEGFQTSKLRRIGIRFLSGLIRLLLGISVKDVTSGFRAVNKTMIAEFSRNYAQDYPEPEAILSAALQGARIHEVPVLMHERTGGHSSIHAFYSAFYMVKVSIALIVERLSYKKRRG